MIRSILTLAILVSSASTTFAQYENVPEAKPPYYRVTYEGSKKVGELQFDSNFTIWIPPGVQRLRGVVVHQHGCGIGSCRSGITGAFDLHWQALAKKHQCALLSPVYEQPKSADCQLWCDPRNGSDAAFRRALADLGKKSGHRELSRVPWALWGHSGGGHWCGGMLMLHPKRIAAAFLRSGTPLLKANPKRKEIKPHKLPADVMHVPVMVNLGTREGVTNKKGRFVGVWPGNEAFFLKIRGEGGLIGVSVDPLTAHECGNQRYFAMPWLDTCLKARLPEKIGQPLRSMAKTKAWLAKPTGFKAKPEDEFSGEKLKASWLPGAAIAKSWMEYVKDTKVSDTTPPPNPRNVRVKGNKITWQAEADVQSGLAGFIIERNGKFLARIKGNNRYGRPVFQRLQYSDTPTQPLLKMEFVDKTAKLGKQYRYRVISVNTVGLKSR